VTIEDWAQQISIGILHTGVLFHLFCGQGEQKANASNQESIIMSYDGIPHHRRLQGGAGGSGSKSDVLVELIIRGMVRLLGPELSACFFVALGVFLCVADYKSRRIAREKIERERRENHEWVKTSCPRPMLMQFPSEVAAKFRGYYSQYGRDHSLCEFQLTFEQQTFVNGVGVLSGRGNDKVGGYTVKGIFNCNNGRMAFTKKYYRGFCCNSKENLGHEVEYRGCVQGCLAAGIRGRWVVSTNIYSGNGDFHIWPTQPVQQSSEGQPSRVNMTKSGLRQRLPETFVASVDNECVVCFDANVSSVVRPCGHISMCSGCAIKVTRCPICRGYVDIIEPYVPFAQIAFEEV